MNIIFDMDGVILDSEAVYLDAYREIASKYGLDAEILRTAAVGSIGTTEEATRGIMREALEDFPDISSETIIQEGREYFAQTAAEGRIRCKPGVHEILSFLRSRGDVVGLASSSPRAMIEEELGKLGVLPYFDVITSGDMVTKSKPDPEIFLKCAEEMGVAPSEYAGVIVVEDSVNGIRAAHAAGMTPVMVPDLVPPTREIREMCAAVLPSLGEVQKWLSDGAGCRQAPLKIMCIGDSNTFGYDPAGMPYFRYPHGVRWTGKLEEAGHTVINCGQNGMGIPAGTRQIAMFADYAVSLMPLDLITVMLGSNDLLAGRHCSAEEVTQKMKRFLSCFTQSLREQSTMPVILLIAPPPMKCGAWVESGDQIRESKRLAECYRHLAEEMGIAFADAGEWGIGLGFDGVHFTEDGHAAFAEGLMNLIGMSENLAKQR